MDAIRADRAADAAQAGAFRKSRTQTVLPITRLGACMWLVALMASLAGCGHARKPQVSDSSDSVVTSPLRGNLSAEDFKQALIGKWISVFRHDSRRNIESLELGNDGLVKMTVSLGEQREQYLGRWQIGFDREPNPGMITFASITISEAAGKSVILSRVNFGEHNGVILGSGPFLRINREPFGVLKRTD